MNREWKIKLPCAMEIAVDSLAREITSLVGNNWLWPTTRPIANRSDSRSEKSLREYARLRRDQHGECRRGCDIPNHVGTHLKGILVGIFVACRVKNCQHLNRLRHNDEKHGYRPDADDTQLDTACRLGRVRGFRAWLHHDPEESCRRITHIVNVV